MSASIGDPIIEVEHLTKHFPVSLGRVLARRAASVHAVEDVTLSVRRGETLGIVGESGCGKSTTARLMLKLLEPTAGTIRFDGRDITQLDAAPDAAAAARDADGLPGSVLVAQPAPDGRPDHRPAVLDPQDRGRHAHAACSELMARCGMNPEHYNRYPHEFSGGQRQRIGVARALALRPKLIVCDEPVSALDVSIQAQILNLLESLQSEFDLTYVFISHDLSVIRQISDRIAVMYLGRVVELADSRDALRASRATRTRRRCSRPCRASIAPGRCAGSASC